MWACGAFLLQSLVCVKGMAHATLGLSGLVGYCPAGFLTKMSHKKHRSNDIFLQNALFFCMAYEYITGDNSRLES